MFVLLSWRPILILPYSANKDYQERFMGSFGLKVFVLYSSRFGAEIGYRTCRALRTNLDPGRQYNQFIWNAELLKSPKLRLLAAKEAMESDLVLVAALEGSPLEEDVIAWLALWQKRDRTDRGVLVALLKRESVNSPHLVAEALHEFAKSARMDFFCLSQVDQNISAGEFALN